MEELKFSLELKEVPVHMTKGDGTGETYVLRELTGKQRDIFLNDMNKRMKYMGGKAAQITDFQDLQANLLALCLFNREGKLVKVDEIQSYPASVLQSLFKAAQALSGLELEEEEIMGRFGEWCEKQGKSVSEVIGEVMGESEDEEKND